MLQFLILLETATLPSPFVAVLKGEKSLCTILITNTQQPTVDKIFKVDRINHSDHKQPPPTKKKKRRRQNNRASHANSSMLGTFPIKLEPRQSSVAYSNQTLDDAYCKAISETQILIRNKQSQGIETEIQNERRYVICSLTISFQLK